MEPKRINDGLHPYFKRIVYSKEVNEVFFKPFLTWALKEKITESQIIRSITE
jgi:hypothetical protein